MNNPNSVFLFVSKDEKQKIIDAAKRSQIREQFLRIRPASRSEMPVMIAASDFSIFFIKPVFSKKASSPTKQGEIMAMGKPVICNSGVGDTDHIIDKYHSGILIKEFSDTAYDKAIIETMNKKFDRTEIRSGAIDFFSLEKGIKQYADVYSKVLNAETN